MSERDGASSMARGWRWPTPRRSRLRAVLRERFLTVVRRPARGHAGPRSESQQTYLPRAWHERRVKHRIRRPGAPAYTTAGLGAEA